MAEVKWFKDLVDEDLSGVTFVRDYVQLHFNPPPTLNVYTPITVTEGGREIRSGSPEFANALIAQIDKFVSQVSIEPGVAIRIEFRDGSAISFSIRQEDIGKYDAFTLFDRKGAVFEE